LAGPFRGCLSGGDLSFCIEGLRELLNSFRGGVGHAFCVCSRGRSLAGRRQRCRKVMVWETSASSSRNSHFFFTSWALVSSLRSGPRMRTASYVGPTSGSHFSSALLGPRKLPTRRTQFAGFSSEGSVCAVVAVLEIVGEGWHALARSRSSELARRRDAFDVSCVFLDVKPDGQGGLRNCRASVGCCRFRSRIMGLVSGAS
jgi:hypothetical protein